MRYSLLMTMALLAASPIVAEKQDMKEDELPGPVLKAVKKLSPTAKIESGGKMTGEDSHYGPVSYLVRFEMPEGWKGRYLFSPDGKLKQTNHNQLKLTEVPSAVRKTIEENSKSGTLGAIWEVTVAGKQPFYDFRVNKDVKAVAADGKLMATVPAQ